MAQLPASALQGHYLRERTGPFYDQSNLPGPRSNPGVVSNAGTIQTDNLGSVFLIGPQVENGGTILTPIGQIGLAAGTDVELDLPTSNNGTIQSYPGGETRTALTVKINNSPNGYTASTWQAGSSQLILVSLACTATS